MGASIPRALLTKAETAKAENCILIFSFDFDFQKRIGRLEVKGD